MIYLLLFYEFFKIGLFAVGGGPATLPFLMELTERYDWYSMADLTNMIAVSESTPGPIGINMATYAGFHAAGISGGITATMGLVLPSIIVIVLVARFLTNFSQNTVVQAAFSGIRPAVTALIASAVLSMMQVALVTETGLAVKPLLLCILVFVLLQIKRLQKLHPAFWILFAAAAGILFRF